MFTQKTGHDSQLEAEIDRVQTLLATKKIDSDEYATILKHLTELHKMKEAEKPSPVSKDTMLTVGANILGILLIIRHEHLNVITSRAMDKLARPK
ncbi:MAG: hypothetical protein DMF69_22285 [Acidobacteria bacterium]|nr:MAG: hypothetical protein DMF69_22285 [Acidobacteriota bacterium]